MFTQQDLQQIEKHGLIPEAVELQLENFRRGFPFLNVVRAASPGDGVLTLTLKDQYFNMRKMVEPHPQVIDKALKAMEKAGVNPIVRPIRGGTDGARLSFMGLPCPNLFTGGMNFHGKFEYCSLTTMHKTEQVILNLAQLWAE